MCMYPKRETETRSTSRNLTIDKINNPFLLLVGSKNFKKTNYFKFTSLANFVVFTPWHAFQFLKLFFLLIIPQAKPPLPTQGHFALRCTPHFCQALLCVVEGHSLASRIFQDSMSVGFWL